LLTKTKISQCVNFVLMRSGEDGKHPVQVYTTDTRGAREYIAIVSANVVLLGKR